METTTTPKPRQEVLEGIAFQFCKVATIALIAGRFVLPVASGLAAGFYLATILAGKNDTRCFLRKPWLLVLIWGCVCAASTALLLNPGLAQPILNAFHRS